MDGWEKFNETSLPEKEDITDADYALTKRLRNKKFRRISWFVCLNQYIIVH